MVFDPRVSSTVLVCSNLPNIMHVATKVHMMIRRFAVLTCMHDNKELMSLVTLWNNTKSTLQYHDNDDNMMCTSMWFEFFGESL